jgi:radical SAM protein with 4Fe4S-binding SPASM domain
MKDKFITDARRMDDTKTLWHMDRVIDHFDKGKRIAPIHIDMGIAKFCNIFCLWCFGKFQNQAPIFIQREPLLQAMKDAPKIGVKSIGIIGDGEPTCNPYLYEALTTGKENGLDLALSTNGVLIDTDKKVETVLDSCKWMRFCLSAGTRDGYKIVHQVDRFDIVVKNIKRFVDIKKAKGYKCEIGLQAVFVPTLLPEEMIKEAQLAIDLGVDYFVIKQCSLPDDGESGMIQFDINDYDNPKILNILRTAQELSTVNTQIIPKWKLIAQKGQKPYNGCLSIPLLSEISGNGDWYPCGYMFGENSKFKEEYRFGNIHEKTLKEIWESDRYWSIIEKMKNFNVHKQCKGCCRQDKCNEFIYNYINKPQGINFI